MPRKSRNEFEVAIICALPLEFDAVESLLDESYDEDTKPPNRPGDANWYRTGRVGPHDLVLTCLADMGKGSAASAASSLPVSFPALKLALVVGICGSVPVSTKKHEIILGDVIIGDSIVQYDTGKQYSDGFRPKGQARDIVGRSSRDIRSFISGLKTRKMHQDLEAQSFTNLSQLCKQSSTLWDYPGALHDVLFAAEYRHKHYSRASSPKCICASCNHGSDPVCEEALERDCSKIGCAGKRIYRHRLSTHATPQPMVHFGIFASADTVMKSGEHRDALAKSGKVTAFEMEGAGVWDNLPCLIIKGVSDYADSHKNKNWQNYAAATAASCAKGLLQCYSKVSYKHDKEPSLGEFVFQGEKPISLQPRSLLPFHERPLCGCICHKTRHLNTPKALYEYLGMVFISHSGFPAVTRQCNDSYCQRPASPSGYMSLQWPPWLTNKMMTFAFSQAPSPELLFRVSNIVPSSSALFYHASRGNVNDLKLLFDRGQASPFDISMSKGQSALRLAVSRNQLEVCDYLIGRCADPYLEDQTQLCAFDIAWNKIFSQTVSNDMQTRLRGLFSRTERLENRGFTRIHKAVLGLMNIDLEQELNYSSRIAINQRDAEGRTAVSWAAWRGDLNAVQLLIKHGCDVRIASRRKLAPIHYAVESMKESVVNALIEAGADPNYPNADLLTPLHWATINSDDPCFLKSLISFGASVKVQNTSGMTPLMIAVQHNHFQSAEALIKHGADTDAKDEDEWTALNFAIFLNHHRCVRPLLGSNVDWTHTTEDGSSFLHFVAEYADLETLQILLAQQIPAGCFPIQQHRDDGMTLSDIIGQRELSEKWHSAFEQLTESVWK